MNPGILHSLSQRQFHLYVAQENVAADAKLVALPNGFEATVQAVEEAIINAMVAAEAMEGTNGKKAYALPHKLVIDIELSRHAEDSATEVGKMIS